MGHVVREINLAEELMARGVKVGFETKPNTPGYYQIFDWLKSLPKDKYAIGLNNFDWKNYNAVIVDLEHGPGQMLLEEAKSKFGKVIVIGGVGFPPVGHVREKGFSVLVGKDVNPKTIDSLVDLQIYQSVDLNDF